jgi:hypothetical protein
MGINGKWREWPLEWGSAGLVTTGWRGWLWSGKGSRAGCPSRVGWLDRARAGVGVRQQWGGFGSEPQLICDLTSASDMGPI